MIGSNSNPCQPGPDWAAAPVRPHSLRDGTPRQGRRRLATFRHVTLTLRRRQFQTAEQTESSGARPHPRPRPGTPSPPGIPRGSHPARTAGDPAGPARAPVRGPGSARRLEEPGARLRSHGPTAAATAVWRVDTCDSQWRVKTQIHNENQPLSAIDSQKTEAAPSCSKCPK